MKQRNPMRVTSPNWAMVLLTLGAVVLPGCSDQSPVMDADVTVAAATGGIDFQNSSEGPIVYTALERRYFVTSLAVWGPCPDLSSCRLDPGERTLIPLSAIVGYTEGATEAVVAWWQLVADGRGGLQVENPQTVSVVLVPGASAIDATVEFTNVGSRCWVLESDSVVYEPTTLPENLKVAGLDIHAVVESAADLYSTCMMGDIVRVLSIEAR
jgi:hypothetical protein